MLFRSDTPLSVSEETWDLMTEINLRSGFFLGREVGRHMLERQSGNIVNICSIMGSGANEMNIIAYTAAKGALRNLTQQLGCEWADRGVRVNAVSPGFIITEMVRPTASTARCWSRRTRRSRRRASTPRSSPTRASTASPRSRPTPPAAQPARSRSSSSRWRAIRTGSTPSRRALD